ncbi:MAG: MFS transporter [Betaproteobacteria bacterium]|nr:MFS transporter [Betaproteobacteria bacterium]
MHAPSARLPLLRDAEVMSLVAIAHSTSHFFQLVWPPLFPWLMPAFGLSFTEVGALMTVFFVVSGVSQALAGFAVDRFGARRALLAGILLLGLGAVLLGVAKGWGTLALAAAVAGLGNSVFHPADFSVLNHRVSTPRLSHAFSVHSLSGYIGWVVAPPFMVGVATLAGWRNAAFAAAAVAAGVLVLLYLRRATLDDTACAVSGEVHAVDRNPASTLAFLRSRTVWMCFGFFLTAAMAFGALQTFTPALLERLYDMSVAVATSALSAYLAGGAAGIMAGGFLAAGRDDQDRIIVAALLGAAGIAVLVAMAVAPGWAVMGLMALMGFLTGIVAPSRDLLVRRAAMTGLGKRGFGRVYGVVYSGLDVGLAAAPLAFGPLMDAARYPEVLIGVALLQGMAIFTAIRVGARSRPLATTA